MRDDHIDLCGQVDFTRTEAMPLLGREAQFCFACAGCGDCCRGREDIVLSGFDLWRIAARLRLPPQIVARGYCRASIGQVSYFLQPTGCGGQVIEARVQDYLSRYDVPAREALDVRWALTCMELEDEVERLEAVLSPVLLRRAQAKLWQALYYHYDYAQPWLPQLEANLHGLKADWAKLTAYQQKQNVRSK